jgi:hypothetical protein
MYRELREASVEWDGDLTKLTMPQLLKLAASMKQLEEPRCSKWLRVRCSHEI